MNRMGEEGEEGSLSSLTDVEHYIARSTLARQRGREIIYLQLLVKTQLSSAYFIM